jgi:hypothetical protein
VNEKRNTGLSCFSIISPLHGDFHSDPMSN